VKEVRANPGNGEGALSSGFLGITDVLHHQLSQLGWKPGSNFLRRGMPTLTNNLTHGRLKRLCDSPVEINKEDILVIEFGHFC
jgi:hypothetical protein